MVPPGGSGGGGSHTSGLISGEICSASRAPVRCARVLVGRPLGPIQIHVICLYAGLGCVESDTGMTSTSSSSFSTTVTTTMSSSPSSVTPSSPSPSPGDVITGCLGAIGYGHRPMPWMAQGGSR
jgi:hypothetical protein